MKTIYKQTAAFILTLILTATAFAAPVKNLPATDESNNTQSLNAETFKNGRIPPAVLDANFRWWQPPQPVPVMASFARYDIAWTDGYAIYYNPNIVSQVPPKIAVFFLAHEYGHIYGRTGNEVASDQFAAQTYAQVDMGVVYAAIWHMSNIQPNACDQTHPCGWQRAYIIGEAAGLSRAQTESVMHGEF